MLKPTIKKPFKVSLRYFNCCVTWDTDDVHNEGGLCDLIDNIEDISRKEFLEKVCQDDLQRIESDLMYDEDFTMANDWHVNYFISKHHNQTVYGFQHSAIEYVFK
jgi:hypothetical protein